MKSIVKYFAIIIAAAISINWVYLHVESDKKSNIASIKQYKTTSDSWSSSPFSNSSDQNLSVKDNKVVTLQDSLSKVEQIEKLTSTGDPSDAFNAFKLVASCHRKRENMRSSFPVSEKELAEACGNITQVQIVGRIQNLEKAVRAGVPGSALEFLATGPIDGDLSALDARPNDPLVVEWKRKTVDVLVDAAKKGDIDSLIYLSTTYQMGSITERNPELALAYEITRQEILKQRGEFSVAKAKASEKLTVTLSQGLPSEKVASAISLGKQIARGLDR